MAASHGRLCSAGEEPRAEKYELAARMLDFPNGGKFDPPAWIPREIATYASFNLQIKAAFEASKTLINEYVGDEVFEDVLDGILNDPNGPHIDIRKDLIALLGTRVNVISDYKLPITPKSERILVAIETNDPKSSWRRPSPRSMKADPQARRREINGHVIWEVVEEEDQMPMVTIENQPAFGPVVKPEEKDDEEKDRKLLPNSAITVANGHLLWATHVDFLVKVLSAPVGRREAGCRAWTTKS